MSDLIDRHAAIEICEKSIDRWDGKLGTGALMAVMKNIRSLPPAQPEQKVGKWLKISPAGIYECSRCGQVVMTSDIEAYKYCHGCGKRMEG